MHCNGFKHEKSLVKQKCKEFLAFNFLEVRFLVDSSSRSNNKSLTNAIVVPPSNSSRSNTQHTHTYANNSDEGHQASARAVRVVQLFSMGDSRTERLRVPLPVCNSRPCIAERTLSGHVYEHSN